MSRWDRYEHLQFLFDELATVLDLGLGLCLGGVCVCVFICLFNDSCL